MGACADLCLYVIAVFIPPVAVVLRSGCGADFLINLLLTILGWLPGVIHAFYVIAIHHDRGHVEYGRPSSRHSDGHHHSHHHGHQVYPAQPYPQHGGYAPPPQAVPSQQVYVPAPPPSYGTVPHNNNNNNNKKTGY